MTFVQALLCGTLAFHLLLLFFLQFLFLLFTALGLHLRIQPRTGQQEYQQKRKQPNGEKSAKSHGQQIDRIKIYGYLCLGVLRLKQMKNNGSILLFGLLLLFSCKKDNINEELGIPYVNVDRYVLLNDPNSLSLNAVGGYLFLNDAGSRGIVIYHRSYEEYVAYDRHCTYNTTDACGKVALDSTTNVILNCACCTSKFSLIDVSVLNGPSIKPLLQYNAQLSGVGTLHIYN